MKLPPNSTLGRIQASSRRRVMWGIDGQFIEGLGISFADARKMAPMKLCSLMVTRSNERPPFNSDFLVARTVSIIPDLSRPGASVYRAA